jgi:hypothetical protein
MMRRLPAGSYLLLLLALSAACPPAFGQVKGFVENLGFDRAYRPDAWLPMVVNLTSTITEPADYLVQVVQPDMDGDTVLYTRQITLGPSVQNERFWMYFRPQPSGLDNTSSTDLQKQLQVRLLTKSGKHLDLLQLPKGTVLQDFDPRSGFTARRGKKLILAVVRAESPSYNEYDPQNLLGVTEDVEFIKAGVGDLPESALGYDMVDAVVWFDANAKDLLAGGSRRLPALQEWVRQGGRLVVCQPVEGENIEPLAPMLPVELASPDGKALVEMIERVEPEPIHTLATEPVRQLQDNQRSNSPDNWWRLTEKGPMKVARALAKTDAYVEAWVQWTPEEGGGRSPYIARSAYGLGSVTWVAQDLASPSVTGRNSSGWPHVWDRVFGWKNKTVVVKTDSPRDRVNVWGKLQEEWGAGNMADLGGTFLGGMDHGGKAGAYVFLVILFFIGYWIVAGPGSYLFLAGKGQRQLSWPIFAVSAMAATLLTVLVVKMLLRGDPEVRHVSVVRLAPASPAVVNARVGLYIPRDGPQTVALRDVYPDSVSTVTALAIHPQHLGAYSGFPDTLDYRVDVRDDNRSGGAEVSIPYRSTLKKLQVHWVGNLPGGAGIVGDPELVEAGSVGDVNGDGKADGYIGGRVSNKTGNDLKNVFFAFTYEAPGVPPQDYLFYVPVWKKDEALDLLKTYAAAELMFGEQQFDKIVKGTAGLTKGLLENSWGPNLLRMMRGNADGMLDDSKQTVRLSVVVLSLFDRIPPMKNDRGLSYSRSELLRRGGRDMDMSHLLAAGNLVMVGEVDSAPLPFPMDVEGDRMKGEGRVFYQATLPLRNRSKLSQPPPVPEAKPPQARPPADAAVEPATGT